MKVLVIGKGGREHAIVWKLGQSPQVDTVFAAPGSDAIAEVATCVPIGENAFDELIAFAKKEAVDLTVVGPEQPLVEGIVNRFQDAGLAIFGPTQEAAMIEGSKSFAKQLMETYSIPTGEYRVCDDYRAAVDYVKQVGTPIVIKADGLAAGKGVTVALTEHEALSALADAMAENRFGEAGTSVVIEEFLTGEEFSLMAFVDGEHVYPMALAQDHKRAFVGDLGPNTGGMGAYSPVPQLPEVAMETAMDQIMKPIAQALVKEGRAFKGVLFAGLMWTASGPKVIEFNARFGDPETQVVLPRLESDLFEVMIRVVRGDAPELNWSDDAVCGFVLASEGYPGTYEKGKTIADPGNVDEGALVFHAGTKKVDDHWVTDGGRVLLVARQEKTLSEAIENARKDIESLSNENTFYRQDIGYRAMAKLK